jgi:hypothetical protein
VAYIWHGALHNVAVCESLEASGFKVRSQIVWVKTRAPISRGNYHWQHEPAFYAERDEEDAGWQIDQESLAYTVRTGKTANWKGGRKQTTVWFIEHLKNDTGHGTQKPVECMRRPILNNSSPGQAIYEPLCGSGSTIIAGEMEGRHVLALHANPHRQFFASKFGIAADRSEPMVTAQCPRRILPIDRPARWDDPLASCFRASCPLQEGPQPADGECQSAGQKDNDHDCLDPEQGGFDGRGRGQKDSKCETGGSGPIAQRYGAYSQDDGHKAYAHQYLAGQPEGF